MMGINSSLKTKKTVIKTIIDKKYMLFVIEEKTMPNSPLENGNAAETSQVFANLFEKDNFDICWKGNISSKFSLAAGSETENFIKKIDNFFIGNRIELEPLNSEANSKKLKKIIENNIELESEPLLFESKEGLLYGSDERIEEEPQAQNMIKHTLLLMNGQFKLPLLKFYLSYEEKCYFLNLAFKHYENDSKPQQNLQNVQKELDKEERMINCLKQMKLLKKILKDFSKTQFITITLDTSKPKRLYSTSFELFSKKWDFKLYTEDDNYGNRPGVYLFLQDKENAQFFDLNVKFRITTADGKFTRYCEHLFDSEFLRKGKGWGGDLNEIASEKSVKEEYAITKPIAIFNLELTIDAIELTSVGDL